ncbi:MAG TPA: hypothetical protein VLG36_05985 [Candidatus Chromulinivoraceae bacterium]|nr:hypothetical protein [Candidatus Chromulinivoraceae bacterium]
MNVNKKFFLLLVLIGLISSSAFFLFPAANAMGLSYAIFAGFATTITETIALWYFLSSLKTFKSGLKTAYYWLAAGIVIFNIGSGVVSGLAQLIHGLVVLVSTPYVIGTGCMYVGMRKFMKLLGSDQWLSSFISVLVGSTILVLIVMVLPHPKVTDTELMFDMTFAPLALSGIFSAAAALEARHIRQIIGPIHKEAMAWTTVAMGTLTVATTQEFIAKSYFLNAGYSVYHIGLTWYLLVGIFFLRAGWAFKEISRQSLHVPDNASYTDVVVSVAQLVSRPSEIDEALDSMRTITAKGSTLSQVDEVVLIDLYLYLEDYLIIKEPLHKFVKEGLRNGLPEGFIQALHIRELGKVSP